jgi:tetratricopeptide (TPR) repeat protein
MLAASDEAAVRRRHAEHFRAIVEPLFALQREGSGLYPLIESLRAEYDNVLAALAWYAEAGDAEGQLRLAIGFYPYWYHHGPWTEARRLTDEALARYQGRDALRANGLWVSAVFAWRSGQGRAGLAVAREAREIARGLDDKELEFAAVLAVGTTADNAGEFQLAEHAYHEAETLAREAANPSRLQYALNNRGNLALHQRQLSKAKVYLEEAVEIDREHGFDSALANTLIDLGFIALAEEAVGDALAHIRESLVLARDHGLDETLSWGLLAAAAVAGAGRSWTDAAKLLGAAASLQERLEMGSYYELGEEFAERTERTVREQVGDEGFAAAASTGRSMPRAQAIELALGAVG